MSVTNAEEMMSLPERFLRHIIVQYQKGGHSINDVNDLCFYYDGKYCWFEGKRIDNPNTHGTGCTEQCHCFQYCKGI